MAATPTPEAPCLSASILGGPAGIAGVDIARNSEAASAVSKFEGGGRQGRLVRRSFSPSGPSWSPSYSQHGSGRSVPSAGRPRGRAPGTLQVSLVLYLACPTRGREKQRDSGCHQAERGLGAEASGSEAQATPESPAARILWLGPRSQRGQNVVLASDLQMTRADRHSHALSFLLLTALLSIFSQLALPALTSHPVLGKRSSLHVSQALGLVEDHALRRGDVLGVRALRVSAGSVAQGVGRGGRN